MCGLLNMLNGESSSANIEVMSAKILLALLSLLVLLVLLVGAPVSAQDPSAELRRQVRRGAFQDAETLLRNQDVDPNAQDGRGFTALMFAAEGDVPEIVTLLIKAEVDLNLQNNDGETALIVAVRETLGTGLPLAAIAVFGGTIMGRLITGLDLVITLGSGQ